MNIENYINKLGSYKLNQQNRKKLSRLQTLLLYFFIFSFLGWLLETFYSLYELGHFTKRGFLYGPICPIYGCGATILILFFSKYKGKSFKLFIYAAVIFSIFEYIVRLLYGRTVCSQMVGLYKRIF